MIATVTRYIDALATHDSSNVPFASSVERWEIGSLTGKGVPHTRAVMDAVPDLVVADPRFFVDAETHNVLLFGVIRIPSFPLHKHPDGGTVPASLHHSERWLVRDGLIYEVEAIFLPELGSVLIPSAAPQADCTIGSRNWPRILLRSGPAKPLNALPICENDSRSCLIATARAYLDGILMHDLSGVPLAADWVRTENGKVTGAGQCTRAEHSSINQNIYARRDENARFWVDEESNTVVSYSMFRGLKSSEGLFRSFHVAHRFFIENGLISEIEIIKVGNKNLGAINWPEPRK